VVVVVVVVIKSRISGQLKRSIEKAKINTIPITFFIYLPLFV